MMRIAAVGDLHVGRDSLGTLQPHLSKVGDRADVFLMAGDLTRTGRPEEAKVLAAELDIVEVPKVAVLGNHDYHHGAHDEIAGILSGAGVTVLEQGSVTLEVDGRRVGIAGAKGFGGGFAGACGTDFGEPEMKAFVGHTKMIAARLEDAMRALEADLKVALLHYSPIEATLSGERLEIFPFLGSYHLAEAIDRTGADVAFHGHAHNGSEKGLTPGGVAVRNVALPVIKHAYNIYCLGEACEPAQAL